MDVLLKEYRGFKILVNEQGSFYSPDLDPNVKETTLRGIQEDINAYIAETEGRIPVFVGYPHKYTRGFAGRLNQGEEDRVFVDVLVQQKHISYSYKDVYLDTPANRERMQRIVKLSEESYRIVIESQKLISELEHIPL